MHTTSSTIHFHPAGAPRNAPGVPLTAGPLVLTVAEAAKVLGISRALAYELVARGELPAIRLGRRVVIPRARLEALVAGEESSGTAALR